MMKLSKEELKQKINDLAVDDDVKITLLEDVEDSFETEDNSEELTALQTKYEELKEKYKSRFLNGKEEDKKEDDKKEEELEEQEIVEETDIFKEKEGE